MKHAKCPGCGNDAASEGNPFRPFCSERCKLIDLGQWVSGRYRIPTVSPAEQEDEVPAEKPDSDSK